MFNKAIRFIFLVLLAQVFFVSCGMKEAPEDEKQGKSDKLRTGAQIFKSSIPGNEVYSLADQDVEGSTSVVPSLSVYDYIDRIKKTLGRESKIDVDDSCLEILGIGQTDPVALEIDYKINQDCASLPEGEASHTDPSPLDDNDSWIICEPTGGGVEDGPGGSPDGGSPSSNADNSEGSEKPGLGSIKNVLCGPAVGPTPAVDPRLVYPDPNKVDGMIAELAPCINKFCPWKLIPLPPDPEDDPTDPIDPSPEDDVELPEEIKEKLPCDKFRGLCEPDITLISKNDLVKGDDDSSDKPEPKGTCDGECDGVCTKQDGSENPGESCTEGDVGSKESDWKECAPTEVSKGSVCTEHTKNEKGESEYTITHGNGVSGDRPSVEEQERREQEAQDLVFIYSDAANCTTGSIDSNRNENKTSFTVTCN